MSRAKQIRHEITNVGRRGWIHGTVFFRINGVLREAQHLRPFVNEQSGKSKRGTNSQGWA